MILLLVLTIAPLRPTPAQQQSSSYTVHHRVREREDLADADKGSPISEP
jgi:hypothetical protein